MTIRQGADSNLVQAVERGRVRAASLGELKPKQTGPHVSNLADAHRTKIFEWIGDHGYERALIEVGQTDPDLAVE